MSRIRQAFTALNQAGKKGFIPFITAGDPDLPATVRLMVELAHSGATVIELGVPFSDPMADGPVIQRASERALGRKIGIEEILRVVGEARSMVDTPIVLFSYYNPLLQFGLERLASAARDSGIDGILVTDLIPEESESFANTLRQTGLDMVFLIAPTSTDHRLQLIAERASGFVYAVSRAGVTGAQESVSQAAEQLVTRMRKYTSLPVAVGFGISTPAQVKEVWRFADAAVVGSAIVAEIEREGRSPNLVKNIGRFARSLTMD